jgi:hypothetical protein
MALSKKSRAHRGGGRTKSKRRGSGSQAGDDLVEAFEEMAKHLRGEIQLEPYVVETLHLLRSPVNAKRLRASIRKSDAGKLIERDIDSIGLSRVGQRRRAAT